MPPAARRVRPIYRVFVSSTWLDLQPERRALMDALNRMEEMRFVGMEFFGNRPDDTHDASIDQVELCEVFIGVIGHRYGSGITEAEYRRARELGLPCFVYFKRESERRPESTDHDAGSAAKLAVFKADLLRSHTVKEFTTPEELAANATADLHNWVAARWISLERGAPADSRAPVAPPPDAERTNLLRLLERVQHDWIEGVLEASLHHRAWLELGLDWRTDAVEHPWDRIVVAPDRPIQTLPREDSIAAVFTAAQNTLLVLGEPGAGKTTALLELARDLVARARQAAHEPAPAVLALSTWTAEQKDFADWIVAELGLRYQVPKRIARGWLDDARLALLLDGLDEVPAERRETCVAAINAFEQKHHPPGLAVTCRVAEYEALAVKLRLRAAISLQPLTPEQVERYFAAAGAGLEHLRRALREDAGLRELARTPLMLSVMTMAWRDAPAAAVAGPAGDTPEERRRQLFDAYVQAALHRRGKATGGFTSAQAVHWLAWLAQRMQAHGQTIFAVEQLQPGWLGSAGQRLGYFLATRLLATIALVAPFLAWPSPLGTKGLLAGLSALMGVYIGALDFGLAQWGWKWGKPATARLFILFFSFIIGGIAWTAAIARHVAMQAKAGAPTGALITVFLCVAGFAFCVALDVRALDVKPAATMRWAWRQAMDRAVAGLVAMNAFVCFVFAVFLGSMIAAYGWRRMFADSIAPSFAIGLGVAAMAVTVGWVRRRPKCNLTNVALAFTLVIVSGEAVFALCHPRESSGWGFLLLEFTPALVLGVFGGFTSTMIDPVRHRNAGVWFWLRVPVSMLLFVWFLAMLPGFVRVFSTANLAKRSVTVHEIGAVIAIGAACGLAAFFRFGGFNGVQHFFLRRRLVRAGCLPPRPEAFLDHAAQLALLQKVGFGYRFIHALLLDYFAETESK
jgi:DNA polymerase III delta prime subunit